MGLLKRSTQINLGTGGSNIYQVPSEKVAVIIGGNIANKIDKVATFTISLYDKDGAPYMLLNKLPIPPRAAFSFSGLEQKVVMMAGDRLYIVSDIDNSGDCWLSVSEIDDPGNVVKGWEA